MHYEPVGVDNMNFSQIKSVGVVTCKMRFKQKKSVQR
jgi:hypothetical protein